ncbi:para-aminobenzoate synthase, subunit I [Gonapodya prolifera JEL478]|uniref:Para-aminobenzoate synthase, subunit I n=1 Tax=Gonapodya prolifera (strain JEL478) TaxID=1344416 RepID=A0A139AUC8_GONPJ|nr:para-aminobenzoate synthase, subunit I [Gonapodya prolifera JEL478]|eukprot:KXS20309.1 para-aminobenzoate synthase, subunit I [Gonapodya prolifera JEL478]
MEPPPTPTIALPPQSPFAVVFDSFANHWLALSNCRKIWCARMLDDVLPSIEELERCVDAGDGIAAGWVAYEAAPAFDPRLEVHEGGSVPLLWFGLFGKSERVELLGPPDNETSPALEWVKEVTQERYEDSINRVLGYIREGDTYQVNFTFRQRATSVSDPWALFLRLVAAQGKTYGAYIDTGRFVVCSASPELFYKQDGDRIESLPMKGTAARGLTVERDREQARELLASEKEQAENLMITDMVRNDLGRIAVPGTVQVPHLFRVEKYPTLWTMTSTVCAALRPSDTSTLPIFKHTFPPASITGAPKRSTMSIIRELELSPRGVYTGAVGFLAPGRRAQFNVAIRTVVVDKERGEAEYGVGGGITYGSESVLEWAECATKSKVLRTSTAGPFELLETIKWAPEEGFTLMERHLRRMLGTAEYFDVPVTRAGLQEALITAAEGFDVATPRRVRLLVSRKSGAVTVQSFPITTTVQPAVRLAFAVEPIDVSDPFLYHKTTRRSVYDKARARRPGYDDVLLWNCAGEVCESTIANIAVLKDDVWVTPPVRCGLLAGTMRAELLERGELSESVITIHELLHAKIVRLMNSVRGVYEGHVDCTTLPLAHKH